ncbi:hypothetical protein PF002_g33189 [Phytophthora fragariae]|uniref:Pectate lyase n=1 Tax=Phytophthora fragariae TaxID=53985 RepID=A0A6A3UZI2_9STRA|nr:hypothetical protein PF003_g39701 [Phytophthora fragariae]KAE8876187.1 hypothetical protein PF003_g39699 [Phytophthora fragariae]KAE8952562.1 hypothetical protein PF011_g32665 [Phytophthora fragariae]KAE9158103.1 hypothetical protein PF002_g33189 [Phytophthora fragariae]
MLVSKATYLIVLAAAVWTPSSSVRSAVTPDFMRELRMEHTSHTLLRGERIRIVGQHDCSSFRNVDGWGIRTSISFSAT